jgi:hypothetical protein
MDSFQKYTIFIAIIVLIIILVLVGILLEKDKNNKTFPPTYNQCPDFWTQTIDSTNNDIVCKGDSNNINAATEPVNRDSSFTGLKPDEVNVSKIIDGTDSEPGSYGGLSDTCKKKKWADYWSVQWDGISNYNSC